MLSAFSDKAGYLISSFVVVLVMLSGSATGFWNMPCGPIVAERMDPIVSPGKQSTHVHVIGGGTGVEPTTTYDKLRGSGDSSCDFQDDKSAYWAPALYFQKNDGSFISVPGKDKVSLQFSIYYRINYGDTEKVKAFPEGFRMLAGNPKAKDIVTTDAGKIVTWICANPGGTTDHDTIPEEPCADSLTAEVFFPSCWDGENLYSSPESQSHVVYGTGENPDNTVCPDSHPVRLPTLLIKAWFSTNELEQMRNEAKNPAQPYVLAQGDSKGYGFHADFFNGWDVGVLQSAIDECPSRAGTGLIQDCGPLNNIAKSQPTIEQHFNEKVFGNLETLPGNNPVFKRNGRFHKAWRNSRRKLQLQNVRHGYVGSTNVEPGKRPDLCRKCSIEQKLSFPTS